MGGNCHKNHVFKSWFGYYVKTGIELKYMEMVLNLIIRPYWNESGGSEFTQIVEFVCLIGVGCEIT